MELSFHTTALSRADLRFWLGRLVEGDVYLIRTRKLPPLFQSGVYYQSEREDFYSPRPVENFLYADALLKRGYGDCEDLAGYRCAELRLRGLDAHPQLTRVGRIWHVTVRVKHPDGRVVREDPSKLLGMQGSA